MLDFLMNDVGDIMLGRNEEFPQMKVSFHISKFPIFKIQFAASEMYQELPAGDDVFKIRFKINNKHQDGNVTMKTLNGEDGIRQQLLIRLRTELGDIAGYKDYGSRINEIRHYDHRSAAVQSKLKTMVENIVADLLENPEVIIKLEEGTTYFYCQNLNIYIYSNDKLFFKYSI